MRLRDTSRADASRADASRAGRTTGGTTHCPYLRETLAAWCEAASPPRVLVRSPSGVESRCSSPSWQGCPASPPAPGDGAPERCPALHFVPARYCGATPLAKLVPEPDTASSLCDRAAHNRCPAFPRGERREAGDRRGAPTQNGLPEGIHLARNHLWLEVAGDGCCYLGVDAFLAQTLGCVESVSFVTSSGLQRPTAVLGLVGAGLPLVFPNSVRVVRTNSRLRRWPRLMLDDPYGDGWLFEGACGDAAALDGAVRGLMSGAVAETFLAGEAERLARFVAEHVPRPVDPTGLARTLGRDELIEVFATFFGDAADERA